MRRLCEVPALPGVAALRLDGQGRRTCVPLLRPPRRRSEAPPSVVPPRLRIRVWLPWVSEPGCIEKGRRPRSRPRASARGPPTTIVAACLPDFVDGSSPCAGCLTATSGGGACGRGWAPHVPQAPHRCDSQQRAAAHRSLGGTPVEAVHAAPLDRRLPRSLDSEPREAGLRQKRLFRLGGAWSRTACACLGRSSRDRDPPGRGGARTSSGLAGHQDDHDYDGIRSERVRLDRSGVLGRDVHSRPCGVRLPSSVPHRSAPSIGAAHALSRVPSRRHPSRLRRGRPVGTRGHAPHRRPTRHLRPRYRSWSGVPHRRSRRGCAREPAGVLSLPRLPLQIPTKAFEYLASGTPILAIVDDGATADLMHATNNRTVPDDPVTIAEAIAAHLDRRSTPLSASSAPWRRSAVRQFTREHSSEALVALMESSLHAGSYR